MVQQTMPAMPVVKFIEKALQVEKHPRSAMTHSRRFSVFSSIGTKVSDIKKPCECAVYLTEPLKFHLLKHNIDLKAKLT